LQSAFGREYEFVPLEKVANIFIGNSINEDEKNTKYSKKADGYNYIATKDVGFDNSINYNNGVKIPLKYQKNFKIAHK